MLIALASSLSSFQAFDWYIWSCVSALELLLQPCQDAGLLLRILLGIIWLSSLGFHGTYLKENTKIISRCLAQTMQNIGLLQLDPSIISHGSAEQLEQQQLRYRHESKAGSIHKIFISSSSGSYLTGFYF